MLNFVKLFLRDLIHPLGNAAEKVRLNLSKGVICYKGSVIKNIFFQGANMVNRNSRVSNSHIGYGSYISEDCKINRTYIGRYTSIGPGVMTFFGTHPTRNFVSTFPSFYFDTTKILGFTYHTGEPIFPLYKKAEGTDYVVEIGNDVWIGEGVRIMDGVKIGTGAVVAAAAVVIKDVPPYAVVGGVPAKIIRYRFDPDQINFLLETQWWDKPKEWISENRGLFKDISTFMARTQSEAL